MDKSEKEVKKQLESLLKSVSEGKGTDGDEFSDVPDTIKTEVKRLSSLWENGVNFVFGILSMFIAPLAFSMMWTWFIVPLGVPVIGYWLAFVILLVVNTLSGSYTEYITLSKATEGEKALASVSKFIEVLLAWLVGFIISLFI